MIAAICWIAEAVLETSGAVLAWRRRLTLLAALLAFRTAADIATFWIAREYGRYAYGVALWVCLAGQYLLLCWLACQIIRELANERYKALAGYAGLLSATGGVLSAFIFDRGETLAAKFLDTEIAAGAFLMVLVYVAWLTRKAELKGPWSTIAGGFIVSVGWNVLCAFLWGFWAAAPKIRPVGAILALLVWNWAGWRDYRLEECRADLGTIVPLRVGDLRQISERII